MKPRHAAARQSLFGSECLHTGSCQYRDCLLSIVRSDQYHGVFIDDAADSRRQNQRLAQNFARTQRYTVLKGV